MKVLSVNTYAGSLLIGARMIGAEIVASYEDEKGYGADIQRLNFGGEFPIKVQSHRYWGGEDPLEGVVVIAHPPCSAFSNQNNSADRKGLGSDAFKCTTNVLDFAMGKRADAIAIESVVGTMAGAREIHDTYAEKYGYKTYRIIQNAITFGVPQDRERFWIIFVRADLRTGDYENFHLNVNPSIRRIRSIINETDLSVDRPPADVIKDWTKQVKKWYDLGVTGEKIDALLSGRYGHGMLNTKIDGSKNARNYQLFAFGTRNVRLLDPDAFTTVLLSDAFWAVPGSSFIPVEFSGGRLCTIGEYKAFMGFPRDYKFPEKYLAGKFKEYLSKGVCPPVAAWVLEQIRWNLAMESRTRNYTILPGGMVDISGLTWSAE